MKPAATGKVAKLPKSKRNPVQSMRKTILSAFLSLRKSEFDHAKI